MSALWNEVACHARDANREGYFGGQKSFKKIPKKVLHLFFSLDTSAQILNKFRGKKSSNKSKKMLAFIFQS